MWGGKRVLIFFTTREKKKIISYILTCGNRVRIIYKNIAKADLLVTVYKYPLSY